MQEQLNLHPTAEKARLEKARLKNSRKHQTHPGTHPGFTIHEVSEADEDGDGWDPRAPRLAIGGKTFD